MQVPFRATFEDAIKLAVLTSQAGNGMVVLDFDRAHGYFIIRRIRAALAEQLRVPGWMTEPTRRLIQFGRIVG